MWRELLKDSIRAGLDLENGLHEFVSEDPELVELAAARRRAARPAQAAAGAQRPDGREPDARRDSVLTVGSDCAIGKMTVSLELDREARRRGIKSEFVPTGQTGIAIAGWGIAVDAVVSDFIAGAAERLVVEGVERGGELLLVEGQGSVLHPYYSGVTLGLIHGSRAARLRALPQGGRAVRRGATSVTRSRRSPSWPTCTPGSACSRGRRRCTRSRSTRASLDEHAARRAVEQTEAETGLPTDDPVRFGAGKLVDALEPLRARPSGVGGRAAGPAHADRGDLGHAHAAGSRALPGDCVARLRGGPT